MKRKVTILLVEDDESMLNGMHDLLQVIDIGYDFTILTANNGKTALELIRQNQPTLIVSDIMMPVMDGLAFLEQVRNNPDWFHIPFIFLTAKGEKDEIHAGHLSGADLYITKPFDSMKLLDLIKTQLDRAFKLETTHQQNMETLKKGILQILNHELRTPLTYVTAYYEMLADSMNGQMKPTELFEYLRGIQAGCIRLTRLVDNFIQVIELRTEEMLNKIQSEAAMIPNFNDVVAAAISQVEATAVHYRVTINFIPQPNLPPVFGHAHSLQTAIRNLLDNAIKFTHSSQRSGGSVTLTAVSAANSLRLTIADEGPGLPAHIQPHIFDLFYQYNRSLMEQQGAGVGLTIAKGIVNLHGGQIQVESDGENGCTFNIDLPLTSKIKKSGPSPTNGTIQQATILVVEDDQHLLIGLRELLELLKEPFQATVLTATDGEAGLRQIEQNVVHLIISDIMMSPMNGMEFLDAVRKNPDWVDIPFIFLTARGEPQDIHAGWSRGVQMYITKPYDSDQLLEYATMLLKRHFHGQQILAEGFNDLKRSILELMTPEFRSPLQTVSINSDKLAESLETNQLSDARNDSELKEALESVHAGGSKLTHLVEDFIALAELRTGEAEIAYNIRAQRITEPHWLFMEAIQSHQAKIIGEGLHIHHNAIDNLKPLFGDNVFLANAMHRLLQSFTDLCRRHDQHHIYLIVQNTDTHMRVALRLAQAIDPAEYQAIMENLKTQDAAKIQSPNWMIVGGYIKLHNGRIHTQNNPQTGFILTMTLPLAPASTNITAH